MRQMGFGNASVPSACDLSAILNGGCPLHFQLNRNKVTIGLGSLADQMGWKVYRAARNQNQIGIVMADIDHFKAFNDLHGHAAGDLVLTELAGFLKTRMRGVDIPVPLWRGRVDTGLY